MLQGWWFMLSLISIEFFYLVVLHIEKIVYLALFLNFFYIEY